MDIESTSVMAGSEIELEDTTNNAGKARASRSTTRFYTSADKKLSGNDIRMGGKRSIGPLDPAESSPGESSARIRVNTPPGEVYVLACADDRKRIDEEREGNNCRATADTLSIQLPVLCTDKLKALGIDFDPGPSKPGVADPVTVKPPINGIAYNGPTNANTIFMDCTLAVALHEMGDEMEARGLTRVKHFGVYNYRCIGKGTPPDCPQGLSRHAYADAIDIAELKSGSGVTYNVNDDWVIDDDPDETCEATTADAKDALLHAFVCSLHASGTFHIALTPNYNADHRNHFHLDLTPNVSFIE